MTDKIPFSQNFSKFELKSIRTRPNLSYLYILKNYCHTITNRFLSIEYQWTKAMIVGMMDAFSIYHTVINCLSDIFLHITYFQ